MSRLILMRHAESEGNRDRCFTPHPEIPLTARGREQAADAARWIAEHCAPRAVISSPYARARQTAEIVATAAGLPVTIEHDLRERSYGALAGLPYDTPRPEYDPEAYWTWCPPGGESLLEVVIRAGGALDRVAATANGGDVVVVSHGAVMMTLWRHVTGAWGAPRVVPNAGIVLVEHRDGAYLNARTADVAEPLRRGA